jgi:hypothetical protein
MNTKETQNLRAKCASKARSRIASLHKVEYDALYVEELAKVGLTHGHNRTGLFTRINELEDEIIRLQALLKESV